MMASPRAVRWLAGAALMLVGGLLLFVAAILRWVPCIEDSGSPACLSRQSCAFDYLAPLRPYEVLMGPTVLAGLALVAIAASFVMLRGRARVGHRLELITCAIFMIKPAFFAVLTFLAPATSGLTPHLVWLVAEIAVDLAVVGILLATPNAKPFDYRRLLLCAVPVWLLGWVGSVLDRMVWAALDETAEIPPGTGTLGAVLIMASAIGIAAVTRAEHRSSPVLGAGLSLERPTDR